MKRRPLSGQKKSLEPTEPKIINLIDIDLDGSEWNPDFGNDETLVGLFKLGEPSNANGGSS